MIYDHFIFGNKEKTSEDKQVKDESVKLNNGKRIKEETFQQLFCEKEDRRLYLPTSKPFYLNYFTSIANALHS